MKLAGRSILMFFFDGVCYINGDILNTAHVCWPYV